jgi:hypothetical protein
MRHTLVQTKMMRLTFTVSVCLYAFTALSQNSKPYSKQDSLKAKTYFDNSWKYSLGSVQHQLYLDSALAIMPTNAYYWQQKSMPLYKAHKHELGKPFVDSAVKYDPSHWLEYRAFLKCIYHRTYTDALTDFYTAWVSCILRKQITTRPLNVLTKPLLYTGSFQMHSFINLYACMK